MSMLPDRERRHLLQFHLAKSMGYGSRLVLAAALVGCGLAIQYVLLPEGPAVALIAGGPLLLGGTLFLLVKGFDIRPTGHSGTREWERSSLERYREVLELDRKVKSWDETFVDVTCVTGAFGLLAVLVPVALGVLLLANLRAGAAAAVLAVDGAILILPHWFTGMRRKWRPVAIREQIGALLHAVHALDSYESPPCQMQPMLRVMGPADRRIPVDARVFIRFPDGPEEFLGLQIQVTLNNVQGTNYPYLYAVLVAKREFGLVEHSFDAIDARVSQTRNIIAEADTEEDVDVIVIRQHTTKKSGYHTAPATMVTLARTAWECAALAIVEPARK